MIDVEVDMFDEVARLVMEGWPGTPVYSTYERVPVRFPAVYFREVSNVPVEDMEDSSGEENGAALVYEADVYGDSGTPRATVKAILAAIDARMRFWNFRRSFAGPVEDSDSPERKRYLARYHGLVSKNLTFYRR